MAQGWRNRKTLVLGRSDMIGLLTPAEDNACVEQAYRMHGERRFVMEPKGHIVLDRYPGEWEVMPFYIEQPEGDREIPVFVSTGIALQNAATGPLAYERAVAAGVGIAKKMIST